MRFSNRKAASKAIDGAARLLTPAERPGQPFPRLAALATGAGVLLNIPIPESAGLALFPGFAAAILGAWSMAAWLEERIYYWMARRWMIARLLVGALLVPVGLPAGVLLAALFAVPGRLLGDQGTLSIALFMGACWFSMASLGSVVIVVIDALASAARRFRSQIILAVIGLMLIVFALAAGAARLASDAIYAAIKSGKAHFSANLVVGGNDVVSDVTRHFTEQDAPALALLLVCLFAFVALPALLSACGKLADAVLKRLHPLAAGFRAIAAGELDVRVEEAGSVELISLSRGFNAMAAHLGFATRMERAFGAYLGKHVMERIRAQHGEAALPAASREASVFFADVRGFTAMSEKLEPAQVLAVLNRYFERVVEVIDEHEGYLNKFIGDAVVVVFNGPIDQPDHAERAVRCARALQEAVAGMNAAGAFADVGGLQIGVGIATGPVVAGNLGSSKQMEYTVIGDTVNLASRLTSKAPAGEVWASELTAQRLAGGEAQALEPIQVKGKEMPVTPYRVWPRPGAVCAAEG